MSAEPIVLFDGVLDAAPPRLNRAFLYGDAAFEVLRSRSDRSLVLREPHLARLKRTTELLDLPWPGDDLFAPDLASLPAAPCRVRLVLFGDATALGGESAHTHRVLIAEPIASGAPNTHAIVREGRATVFPGFKVASYAASARLTRAAARQGVHEVLLVEGDRLLEGATSNVILIRAGTLITPDDRDILPGVTRDYVLSLATDAGIRCEQRAVDRSEVASADECFITSAVRGIHPITHLDGDPIGAGRPGPLTRRLQAAYSQALGLVDVSRPPR